ncbi:MAG: leucine-rich repeat protein, partial [Oscillospiraceae bacterium]|nr:leucine-rich repeat protein [Oscillospiraceae bacterium]
DNVTVIGDSAFENCRNLNNYNLPDRLETIGERAFYGVPMEEATLSANVKHIGKNAFRNDSFKAYVVDANNPNFTSENGILYNKDMTVLLATPVKYEETFVLPKSVTKIAEDAFRDCRWIGSINFHEGITEIGKNAFHSSTLSAVILPSTLTGIPDGAFYTDSLKTIYIPTSVSYIGVGAFRGYNLDAHYGGTDEQWAQVVVYGDNNALNGIEKNSHKLSYRSSWTLDLDKMELVTNESSMNYPLYAFKDDIRSVIINAEYGPISAGIYTDWTGLQTVTINSAYIGISENAFAGCTGLTDVYYKNSEEAWVEHGFDKAFPDSPNLTVHYNSYPMSGQLGDNLQWSFDRTTNTLTISGWGPMRDFASGEARPWDECLRSGNTYDLVIAEGVTSVGAFAFNDYSNVRHTLNVHFPSTVETIGQDAFSFAILGTVEFKDGLKTIGPRAFYAAMIDGWHNSETGETIVTMILPNTVERVESEGLNGNQLDVVYLPLSLKYIECSGLYGAEIHYAGSVAQWSRVKNEGYIYSDGYKKIKPTVYDAGCPHIIATEEGKPATCYESGLTGKEYCTHCGYVRKEPQVIEQLSHYFEGDTCTNCGLVIDPSKPLDGNAGGLYWRFDINEATLAITGNGAIPDYANAADVPWSHWSGEVRVLFLDTTVTAIGDNAFAGFDKLQEVRYIAPLYKWQQMDIGEGNEALNAAEFVTSEAFTDVLTADWFYNPVNWAVNANVTGGIG